jgi:hypothetical protein
MKQSQQLPWVVRMACPKRRPLTSCARVHTFPFEGGCRILNQREVAAKLHADAAMVMAFASTLAPEESLLRSN